jgi:hypothetical protein
MTDEDFVARWSRRKRSAGMGETAEEASPQAPPAPQPSGSGVSPAESPEQPHDEGFDVASLPPIDAITADTDVTAFLRKGVPPELARAALRRAWTADPAIRDFIGLAENSWDFNDPTAIPGFGPLDQTPEQVARMVSELFGEVRQAADQVVQQVAGNVTETTEEIPAVTSQTEPNLNARPLSDGVASEFDADSDRRNSESAGARGAIDSAAPPEETSQDIASQHDDVAQPLTRPRRSHGGALPQ